MTPVLYAHPFSSYCWKVLIALYENDTAFDYRNIESPGAGAELAALWPLAKFPLLVDGGKPVIEATIIIEHLALNHPGPVALLPADPAAALEVRFLDRFFDNYVMTPLNVPVASALRPAGEQDAYGVAQAKSALDRAYAWIDAHMQDREWAAGGAFSMADCAAAPSLFYADWVYPIAESYPAARAYRARLLARPSVARAVDEARPYRHYFPLGAPERD